MCQNIYGSRNLQISAEEVRRTEEIVINDADEDEALFDFLETQCVFDVSLSSSDEDEPAQKATTRTATADFVGNTEPGGGPGASASTVPRAEPTQEPVDGWPEETPRAIIDAAEAAKDLEVAAEQALIDQLLEPIQESFTCDVCFGTSTSRSVSHTCRFCGLYVYKTCFGASLDCST